MGFLRFVPYNAGNLGKHSRWTSCDVYGWTRLTRLFVSRHKEIWRFFLSELNNACVPAIPWLLSLFLHSRCFDRILKWCVSQMGLVAKLYRRRLQDAARNTLLNYRNVLSVCGFVWHRLLIWNSCNQKSFWKQTRIWISFTSCPVSQGLDLDYGAVNVATEGEGIDCWKASVLSLKSTPLDFKK